MWWFSTRSMVSGDCRWPAQRRRWQRGRPPDGTTFALRSGRHAARRSDSQYPGRRSRAVPYPSAGDGDSRGPGRRRQDHRRRDELAWFAEMATTSTRSASIRKQGLSGTSIAPARFSHSYESRELLGYEMRYLGTARVERFGDVARMEITSAREEILFDDLLVPAPREELMNIVPHSPDRIIDGRIIALYGDSAEGGRGSLVTLDRGLKDGVDVGTVLAIYHPAPVIADPRPSKEGTVVTPLIDQTKTWSRRRTISTFHPNVRVCCSFSVSLTGWRTASCSMPRNRSSPAISRASRSCLNCRRPHALSLSPAAAPADARQWRSTPASRLGPPCSSSLASGRRRWSRCSRRSADRLKSSLPRAPVSRNSSLRRLQLR